MLGMGAFTLDLPPLLSKYSLMSRPRTISNEQLLRVAREVFLERGPAVATAEIARRAGVSEGTLFKRFATKHELFMAAMGLEQLQSWTRDMDGLAGQADVRGNLTKLTTSLVELFRQLLPRVMLVWSCRGDATARIKALHGPDAPPRRGLHALRSYLAREMAAGRLREGDPELVARIILGSVWNLAFIETISPDAPREQPTAFAERLIDTLWTGIAPGEADR